jgi:hypothetical protein
MVLKYCETLHRYIQTEMDFLEISSLGAAYRYAAKIEQKFRQQNKREFRFANMQQPKYDKDDLNKLPHNTDEYHSKQSLVADIK